MARVLLALFVVFMLLTVLRGLRIFLRAFLQDATRPKPGPPSVRQAEMVRDPVCGTWIDRSIALSGRRGGDVVPVCSEKCRRALERAG